ncbi:PD-(D/E)XK nuclease family protein [Streptomyces rimosus]|uniref:RecB family exonuclease n=1 Tax=Streptomyces rimosus TaxID=1927 RepID=UPI000A6086C9|nr:PD-(D/E)XK nuclease family protein [Streptomyces rimosus]
MGTSTEKAVPDAAGGDGGQDGTGEAEVAEVPRGAEAAEAAGETDGTGEDRTAAAREAGTANLPREAAPADPAAPSAAPAPSTTPLPRTPSPATRPVSLSPSRASDFMQCPLLYRFRVIDKLPEKPSAAATRGTVVHAVLERLFDAPAGQRTAGGARAMVPGEWEKLLAKRPELAELFTDDPAGERLAAWLADAETLVERWFTLEDPTRLEPADRELYVETVLDSGLQLRGFIDRVDVAPTGEVRLVDYKTGKAPRPEYADGPLFQMKFYALVMWRLRGIVPRRLQLVYLGSGDILTYDPTEADLRGVERKLLALWDAIQRATATGDWRPRRTKLCGWCDHQAVCPEFGGTPPPYPLPVPGRAGTLPVAASGEGQGRMDLV